MDRRQGGAKYVAFQTLVRPEEMRGQRGFLQPLTWPYEEGLRLDEAMHPLTIIATGLYGETLPSQNGAPLRLVVPWKYGFKSIKSIVRITLTENQPPTVDSEGEVLDFLVQHRRNTRAAEWLMRKLLEKQGFAPLTIVTDNAAVYNLFVDLCASSVNGQHAVAAPNSNALARD